MELPIIGAHPASQADPFLLKARGRFYVFASGTAEAGDSGNGVPCYVADSLFGPYEFLGNCFSVPGMKEYWAPSCIEVDGKFYLYVSMMPEGEDDVHLEALHVAVADRPEGPYKDLGQIAPPFSIDSHPVMTDEGLFLFYSVNDAEAKYAGTRIVVDKMISPWKAEGHPVEVVSPSYEREIFQKDRFKPGQDWYTIEGACYFEYRGNRYLLYSANSYQNPSYYVGYALAKGEGGDLRKPHYVKQGNENEPFALLEADDQESGTGHNTVTEENGIWYIIYHGRNPRRPERTMRIGELVFDGGALRVKKLHG